MPAIACVLLAYGYTPYGLGLRRATSARRAVSPAADLSILGAEDGAMSCVLLPHTPFHGAPRLKFVGGEMNLQELYPGLGLELSS